nr:imelysin family protein [uncultured Caldimonas sp.]
MNRRDVIVRFALGAALAHAVPAAHAVTAVPFYTPLHFVQGLYQHWHAPRAVEFAERSRALTQAAGAACTTGQRESARDAWRQAALAWDRLASMSVGPLVLRRSARQIDFQPTRPKLIERAIAAAPADARAMERVGTPGKGLPALEWLLWGTEWRADTPTCRYAVQVAADIEREAQALREAYGQAARHRWADEEASAAMSEAVNQWVGAIERLRWQDIGRPAASAHGTTPEFPRAASDSSAASWGHRWQAIEAVTVQGDTAPPAPGDGLVPIETYLRGRGLNPLADRLRAAAREAGTAVNALASGATPGRVAAATTALGGLKRLAEGDVAAALNVNIGFSDADGD